MNLVKKITLKDIRVTENLKDRLKADKQIILATFAGVARDVKTGVGTYGQWYKLIGEFYAFVPGTGEEYQSAQCILPDVANNIVVSGLADSDNRGVDFAFEILAQEDTSQIGYKFLARPLMETKVSNNLAHLKNLASKSSAVKQLQAGQEEAAKTTAQPEAIPETPKPETPKPEAPKPAHKPEPVLAGASKGKR